MEFTSPIRSGRTTRMLAEAKRLANQGKSVMIIAASQSAAETYWALLDGTGVRVEFPPPPGFNWETLSYEGAPPGCEVLVDHFAIESKFGKMLEALHRWDILEAPSNETQTDREAPPGYRRLKVGDIRPPGYLLCLRNVTDACWEPGLDELVGEPVCHTDNQYLLFAAPVLGEDLGDQPLPSA